MIPTTHRRLGFSYFFSIADWRSSDYYSNIALLPSRLVSSCFFWFGFSVVFPIFLVSSRLVSFPSSSRSSLRYSSSVVSYLISFVSSPAGEYINPVTVSVFFFCCYLFSSAFLNSQGGVIFALWSYSSQFAVA